MKPHLIFHSELRSNGPVEDPKNLLTTEATLVINSAACSLHLSMIEVDDHGIPINLQYMDKVIHAAGMSGSSPLHAVQIAVNGRNYIPILHPLVVA